MGLGPNAMKEPGKLVFLRYGTLSAQRFRKNFKRFVGVNGNDTAGRTKFSDEYSTTASTDLSRPRNFEKTTIIWGFRRRHSLCNAIIFSIKLSNLNTQTSYIWVWVLRIHIPINLSFSYKTTLNLEHFFPCYVNESGVKPALKLCRQ